MKQLNKIYQANGKKAKDYPKPFTDAYRKILGIRLRKAQKKRVAMLRAKKKAE